VARGRIKQRAAVGRLGKLLTRRSRGRCELCQSQADVRGFELVPYAEEPEPDRALMACARCRTWLELGQADAVDAWFLSEAVWNDEPAVKLAAARMLLMLDDPGNPWVRDTLDAVDVDPATGELRVHGEEPA
jgi:protein PhnA